MMQAYNYMVESYLPKTNRNYNVLKKGEMKAVYDHIVNLSKHSPFYIVNLSKENKLYTLRIKDAANELKAAAQHISESDQNIVFSQKSIYVSNEDVLTASVINDEYEKLPETIEISVDTLADTQQNSGNELYNTAISIDSGVYEFQISVKNEIYNFEYTVASKTKNQNAQIKLAEFINQKKLGITVMLEQSDMKYSRLILESELSEDEEGRIFSFEDLGETKTGIVNYFGLNNMDRKATKAHFELNGINKQTSSNTFNIDNTIQVSLQASSEQPVTIKLVPNSDAILKEVKSVIDIYNDLVNLARIRKEESIEHKRATKLINDFNNIAHIYQEELEACGINFMEDAIIVVDEVLANQAAKDGGIEDLFTRKNGFITRLIEKSDAIAINPLEYLDKTIVTYPDITKPGYTNPYVTSMYSGMLFNSYC